MSLALPNWSWWLLSGKRKDSKLKNGSSLNSSSAESNVLELDVLKFNAVSGGNIASTSKRVRRKWRSREEGKVDREYDVVLVPSDGGGFSDTESDDSDWSIGWSEPHGPGFLSDDEIDGGFGVLVPCYGRGHGGKRGSEKNRIGNVGNVPDYSAESRKYIERWLSSLQGS